MFKNTSPNIVFGVFFFSFFLIISIWPLLSGKDVRYWSLFISIIFILLTIFSSESLTPLNKLWIKLGFSMGKIISPVMMGAIFFLVVTPISLIMRATSKDNLNLKKTNQKTYWINKTPNKSKMKDQF
jgi:hypothetical protein